MAAAFVVLIGGLVAAVGALGIVSPPRLLALVKRVQTPAGLYAAAGLRIALGVALWVVAPASRAPVAAQVVAVVAFAAGLATPLVGLERAGRLLDWWESRGVVFLRVWCGVALGVGLLLVFLVSV